MQLTRRQMLQTSGAAVVGTLAAGTGCTLRTAANERDRPLVLALMADPHIKGGPPTSTYEDGIDRFLQTIDRYGPHAAVCLGDFVVPRDHTLPSTLEYYREMRHDLERFWPRLNRSSCPTYVTLGNHDVGWIRGGDENVTTADLIEARQHSGHPLSKKEWRSVTGMPHRYFGTTIHGWRLILLDGNNSRDTQADDARDGVRGAYWIDQLQLDWLRQELREHSNQPTVVFCHQELHHTEGRGSGQGGWKPFPQFHKDGSYCGNGWQVRDLLSAHGRVAAVFHGHYHMNRWTVYDGIHYITLDNFHGDGGLNHAVASFWPDRMVIKGIGNQASFDVPLPASRQSVAPAI